MTTVSSERPSLWRRIPARGPWLVICFFLLAGLIAVALYYFYGRQAPVVENLVPQAAKELPPDVQARAAALAEENRKLEEELDKQRSQPIDCPPGQHPEQKASAPTNRVSPAAGSAVGVPPGAAREIPATGKAPILSNKELSDRLEKSTVLLIVDGGSGTGFFIGPQTIVTNRHVAEKARDGIVLVTSRSLGRVQAARVMAMTPKGGTGSLDFALLRLETAIAPAPLTLTPSVPKLSSVYAAGYPGLIMQGDRGFMRLASGDAFASPDLSLTRGEVQSLQTTVIGLPAIVHTASVLGGNSGGPLVDSCGRVVGVNTFIAVDQEQSGRVSYAQPTGELVRFLNQSKASAQTDTRPCG
ncbi:MAG: serine protease [Alphaproteobacteria bacterium]|nr:serine protease [Alphaproteobacteria bacterium]